jgi:WXXGXW repeat (2 copies)
VVNELKWSLRFLLLALVMFVAPHVASAQVRISITIAPPDLPVYDQPICPSDGYIWTPGYWAWDSDYGDYFWVPGTWVEAPEAGFFWTPGYWGWGGDAYVFNEGYWGPQVGFYGGINYGFGYFGDGYSGGRWDNGHFFYNRAVSNVNVSVIRNVYEERVTTRTETRVSFNGGNGGINARPTSRDEAAARERHIAPVAAQTQHVQAARSDQQFRASVNHGKPPVAATEKPGAFHEQGAVAAKEGGTVHGGPVGNNGGGRPNGDNRTPNNETRTPGNENRPAVNPAQPAGNEGRPTNNPVHAKEIAPIERPSPPATGNPKLDQKYQQQQQQLVQKQDQERQRLQQKQDQDHARLTQQKAPPAKTQQLEQKHQQQTQQLQQKHVQQQQQLQQKQQHAPKGPPHTGPGGSTQE